MSENTPNYWWLPVPAGMVAECWDIPRITPARRAIARGHGMWFAGLARGAYNAQFPSAPKSEERRVNGETTICAGLDGETHGSTGTQGLHPEDSAREFAAGVDGAAQFSPVGTGVFTAAIDASTSVAPQAGQPAIQNLPADMAARGSEYETPDRAGCNLSNGARPTLPGSYGGQAPAGPAHSIPALSYPSAPGMVTRSHDSPGGFTESTQYKTWNSGFQGHPAGGVFAVISKQSSVIGNQSEI